MRSVIVTGTVRIAYVYKPGDQLRKYQRIT